MVDVNIYINYFFKRYYYANFDDIRKEVKAMMDRGEWNTNAFPELKNDLLNKLNIQQNTAQ